MSDAPAVTTKPQSDTARLVKLALVASDAAYAGHLATPGMPLAAYRDTPAYDNPQPFQTPQGFVLDRVFDDPATGYKAVAYINPETNELLFAQAGTDGLNSQDWAGNALHTGINQWENNQANVLSYLESRMLADPSTRLIVAGQSLGGALGDFTAHDVIRDLSQTTAFDPSRVALVTFNGSASEYALKARAANNPDDPNCAYAPSAVADAVTGGAVLLNTATQSDFVSYLGGQPLSGRTLILDRPLNQNAEQYNWTPNPNAANPTYAHRIETGLYDTIGKLNDLSNIPLSGLTLNSLTSDPDQFTDPDRTPLNLQETQAVGNWLAGNRSGQYGETESLIRIGLGGVGGVILTTPGEPGGALTSAFQKLGMDTQLANVGGYGAELILKGLCVAAPVPCALTLAAAHGTADLVGMLERSGLHDAAEQLRNQNFVAIGKTPDGATRRIELGNAYDDPQLIDEYFDKTVTISLRDQSQTIYDKTTQEVTSLPGLHIERDAAGGHSAIVLPSGQRVEFDPQQDALSSKPDGSWTVQRSDGSSTDVEPISDKPFQYTAVNRPAPALVEVDTAHPITQEAAIAPPPAFEAVNDTINSAVPQTAPTLQGASGDQGRALADDDAPSPFPLEPAITPFPAGPAPAPPGSGFDNDTLALEPGSAPSGDAGNDPAPQPANADKLTASAITSAANLVLAVEHGDAFAAAVSGMNLANNLSKINSAGTTELDGATSALGTVASALNLYSALESGDAGGIIVSGASLLNVVASDIISNAIGMAFGEVVPVLGVLNSLAHGDVLGAAIGAVGIAFPVAGAVLMVASMVFDGLFGGDEDIPTRYGDAEAQWDSTGHVLVSTTRDEAGGGATAAGWMNKLLESLTNELASRTDTNDQPLYGLAPSLLPRIGYAYDPDTSDGYLRLSWTEADGTVQYRQYDTNGNRHDTQTQAGVNDLARDFFEHAADAIIPAWEAQTLFQQQGSAATRPTATFAGELSADGAHVTRSVLTLGSGSTVTTALDLDHDGYVEQGEWTTAALLAVDMDGDGQVSADELVDGRAGADSRNSLAALDANGDGVLDSRDPGFAALSLWIDANGNGTADTGEVTAAAAEITMIAFANDTLTVTRSDGTATTLTRSELAGDTQGVSRVLTQDGLYEAQEGGTTTLHAVNQHTLDGDTAHQHGGEANPNAHGNILIDAGDTRIHSLGNATAASGAVQTHIHSDALLHDAGTGTLVSGQSPGGQAGDEAGIAVVSDAPSEAPASSPKAAIRIRAGDPHIQSSQPIPTEARLPAQQPSLVFIPSATTSPSRAIQQVTAEMISQATRGLFSANAPLSGIAVAALPLVFPALTHAAETGGDTLNLAPATSDALTDALLRDVLAGRRYDQDSTPAPASRSAAWSAGVVTSNAPRDTGLASSPPSNGEPSHLPVQVLTDWHSVASAPPPAIAPPTASQTLGRADWVTTPQAQEAIRGAGPIAPPSHPEAQSPAAVFINHAPDVRGEQAGSPEDTALIISPADLLANDSDLDSATVGQTLTLSQVGNATHGSVSFVGGQIHFLPDADYFGLAGFDYTVSDGAGGESVATVSLNVQAVNDAPQPLGEAASGTEDTRLLIEPASLLANDADIDTPHGDLHITALIDAHHGSIGWTTGPDGQPWLAFTPDANFEGDAHFTYTVSDGAGGETTATTTLHLASVNDAPLATGETTTGSEDQGIVLTAAQLLANETDVDGDALSIVRVGNSQHGTASISVQGEVNFLPDPDFHGTAGFDYWIGDGQGGEAQAHVEIKLASDNDAPVAQNDILGKHAEDTVILIACADLLRNDSDIDSATLNIAAVSDALHGSVEQLADGFIRFTPEADYNGPAGFRYIVSDNDGGQTTALAVLTISPLNDAPAAHGDTASGNEDHEMVFPAALLLANDIDADTPYGDDLRITTVSLADPSTGSVRISYDGVVHFTPASDYAGPAALIYQVSDSVGLSSSATLAITVLPVNDAPLAIHETVASTEDTLLQCDPALLLANDQDVDNAHAELLISALGTAQHGTVQWHDTPTGRTIGFTPEADFFGEAGFSYTVADGAGGETQAYVTIHVANVNDAPFAHDDSAHGLEDTPLSWTFAGLTENDTDLDSDTLSVTAVGNAHGGTVEMTNGQVTFIPDKDYSGPGGFDYTTSDGHGGFSNAHVALELAAVNDAPTVVGEVIQGMEDTPLEIDPAALLINDSDVDSPTGKLHIVAVGGASHGSLTRLPDGTLRFIPDNDFAGEASFTYSVEDDAGAATSGTATVQVANVNDAPLPAGETITSTEDTALTLKESLLANDTDVDAPHDALGISQGHCTYLSSAPPHIQTTFHDAKTRSHSTTCASTL
ncbi:cadherin-like domain-containing protein [Zoogloea sp.]|uniref:cadherin-like domain-containing protein n=1 Tax=Zoogloea sp. TaxID=49181 RepID=UPI0035ADB0F6